MPSHLPTLTSVRWLRRATALGLIATLALPLTGCSIKRYAIRSLASSLTSGPDVYGTDNDPELVRDALPFGLKTMETLLAAVPTTRACC